MAVKISIGKSLEEKIRVAAADEVLLSKRGGSILRQLVGLIDDAHEKGEKRPKGGLNPYHAVNAVKGVLGVNLILPPNPTPAFYAWIKKRTDFLGLSLEDMERAAVKVRDTWRLPASMEWIVKRLDTLTYEATDAPQVAEGEEPEVTVSIDTGRGEW